MSGNQSLRYSFSDVLIESKIPAYRGTKAQNNKLVLSYLSLNGPSLPYDAFKDLKKAGVCIDCVGIGGKPTDVDEGLLKAVASRHPDGVTPRYAFIGDKSDLIEKFEALAGRITR